jgi:3-oxoacyl-(acyl-carrier-protein) synthase/thioesterase domain-containing protein/acyl carrier protein
MAKAGKVSVLGDVRAIVEATIKISRDRLDIDAEFADLGIDSIIAMELMENLSRHFGISFTPAQFLNVNTVRELGSYIEDNFEIERGQTSPATPLHPLAASLSADQQPAPAQEDDASFRELLDSVKRKYAIDLTGKEWSSIDQIVDEIVSSNLEQAMHRFDIGGEFDHDEPATPLRVPSRDVAIVGISCRFPDAASPEAFWKNLVERKSSIREIPKSRWDWESHYAQSAAPGKTVSKWGALIDDIDRFDPQFFGIRPEEAKLIDPQERLLMQEVYKAIQDAGMDPKKMTGSNTGVFVGYEYAEYEQYLRKNMDKVPGLVCSSSSPTYYLANRLSFVFDFRGPSESINVNCASSAVAINRAYLSLTSGESDLAIAGAACLHLFADDYVTSSQYGLLSPNGTCAVFDNDANGFTRGEGVGALVLKRLDSAIADNDRIYGVIKSCHQSNRGGANTLSEVKHEAITDVIHRCYEKAELNSDSINYIEINGYSKKWADSFEFEGIKNAFEGAQAQGKSCALGSLKGNIGHLEPVNGIASVIKVALSLHNKKFPPTITRSSPSTFIDLKSASHPFYFADAEIAFEDIRKDADTPIRAGVSSFADSGVNVHIALEEFVAPAPKRSSPAAIGQQLFVLSARDKFRLADYVEAFIGYQADALESSSFVDQIHTLHVGREAMQVRLAVLAYSFDELREKLCLFKETGIDGRSRLEALGIFYGDVNQAENSLTSLITQEMTRKQLEISMQTNQWQQIALLWVHGVEIPWEIVWAGQAVQRVCLPSYPFAKDRYWVDIDAAGDPALIAAKTDRADVAVAAIDSGVRLNGHVQWRFSSSGDGAAEEALSMSPAAKLELFLRQEIALQQQRAVEGIDLDSNFVLLGMSSIGIAELINKTNHLLQINLAPSVVFKYPQVRGLAHFLALSYPDQSAALAVYSGSAQTAGNDDSTASQCHGALVPEGAASHRDILIPMQVMGERSPIFLVPGADGSVLSLKLLCEALGKEQPLYGLDAVGLDGKTPLAGSVEEIARLNIAAVRSVRPCGPYRLLGYSNGGIVAFEMARALLDQNEEIESLMLLDSLIPAERKSTEIELVAEVFDHLIGSLGGKSNLDIRQLEQLASSERGEYLYRLLINHGLDLAKEYFIAAYNVSTASEELCRAYTLSKLSREIEVSLFRAVEGYRDVPDDYGWNRFLLKPVRIHEIKANHFSIIEKCAVGTLADMINLSQAKPAASSSASGQLESPAVAPNDNKSIQGARKKKRVGTSVTAP